MRLRRKVAMKLDNFRRGNGCAEGIFSDDFLRSRTRRKSRDLGEIGRRRHSKRDEQHASTAAQCPKPTAPRATQKSLPSLRDEFSPDRRWPVPIRSPASESAEA